jgi:pSer/pThr/pTyr-binding forkhead associated (FHA) protein
MPPLPYTTFPSLPDRHPSSMTPPSYHPDGEYLQWYAPPHSPTAADNQPQAVTITLRSTRPTTFQTRNIILRPDEPVNVGRSSRSEAKNLSATPDNALFDCPVISRRHAELELKVNKWTEEKHTVFIKDTGSMHGTSVNGQKLVPTRPFQLKEGDTIRLGESVNRADSELIHTRISSSQANATIDNYDGVTVTLHCISTATKKTTAQVKSTQQGISVPSDSESEFDSDDDSDGGADLHPSSVHTTPDQGNVKPANQPSVQVGSSRSNVITVEDDDDDEPVPFFTRRVPGQSLFLANMDADNTSFTRRVPAQPVVVPDTFADESVMAADPHAAPAPHASLQFGESYAAFDESEDMEAVKAAMEVGMTAPNANDVFDHEDVNSEEGEDTRYNAWSDDDHFSDEGQDSDEHSESHEDFDRQSFLSEEFNMSDDVAVEDEEDDEGPEVMSSKRRLSNELGTLGDEPNHDAYKQTREIPIAPRPHYDPVRGCEVSAPSVDGVPTYRSYGTFSGIPFHEVFADPGHSNKWDVGPEPALEQPDIHNYNFVSPSYPQQMTTVSSVMPNIFESTTANDLNRAFSLNLESNVSGGSPVLHSSFGYYPSTDAAHLTALQQADFSIYQELNSKKRKAPEISTSDEPVTTTQAVTSSEVIETANVADASTNTIATTAAPAEPQPKKRKIKQPHSQKSMLRTAVIEAGKYTAGAIIGGIGLVTILASPIGEALASC